MLFVLHFAGWLYWFGIRRAFPWPWGVGRERDEAFRFGITIEIV